MYKGVQNLTHDNTRNTTAEGDAVLEDEPFIHMLQGKKTQGSHSSTVMVQEYEVRYTLRVVDPRKTAGRVLSKCAHQLSRVFSKIISASLSQFFIPPSLNSATIVPMPRETISSLNWLL